VSHIVAASQGNHAEHLALHGVASAAENDGGRAPRRANADVTEASCPDGVQTVTGTRTLAPTTSKAPPALLFAGRYRIESLLGTGGMGIVYAATHVELRLPVALKVVHPTLANSREARARFCIEARACAALRSPHTVRVYDAGELDTEECYVVMERLEGTNLDELLRGGGPVAVGVAVDYVLQACAGLAEAHAIGLVHRDIKPENLFLAHYRCSPSLIKIMDFGIARWQGDEFRGGRITNPSSSLGSPCYQSPEQMENACDVDERSDIWSLGLVLFELLTGQCPFDAESIQETCWKVLQGPRPSLRAMRPDVEAGLEDVVQRCLELDRSKRFASVKQLAAALRPFAGARIQLGSGSQTTADRETTPRSRRARSALIASVGFALGIGCTAAFHAAAPRLDDIERLGSLASLDGIQSRLRTTSRAALTRAQSVVQSWELPLFRESAAPASPQSGPESAQRPID
jgi:eukaryotic-like serine/threonine-protein kinase